VGLHITKITASEAVPPTRALASALSEKDFEHPIQCRRGPLDGEFTLFTRVSAPPTQEHGYGHYRPRIRMEYVWWGEPIVGSGEAELVHPARSD